jgi:hypothetical protein
MPPSPAGTGAEGGIASVPAAAAAGMPFTVELEIIE